MRELTDAEVICEFMVTRPGYEAFSKHHLTLDALHEVEAKLDELQWELYDDIFEAAYAAEKEISWFYWCVHANTDQKIKTLAAVLRTK